MTGQLQWLVKSLLVSALLALGASAANAATIQLRAWLNGEQVPLAVPGTGIGVVTFNTESKVVTWNVSYQNLSGACTSAHFHGPAAAGVDAGIALGMACSPTALTGNATLNASQEAQLLSGQWYINIHTNAHVNGEIRGQVVPVHGDFNGDGRSDVIWRNASTGENYLYPLNGITILPAEGYLRMVADLNWKMVAFGDFNGDGKTDIFWRNASTGENYVYLMDGTSIIGEAFVSTIADPNWQVAGAGDCNGDGRADILWRNKSTGENYVYLMDGTTIAGEGHLRTVADQNWQVAGVGDFNGDGKSDILWRNSSSGENYVYLMNGLTIAPEGYIRTVAGTNWRVVGVADFDGDGRADILWRNVATGENYMYPMAGLAIRSTEGYLRTVADLAWRIAALGDFDGEGRSDILWRKATSGDNYVYLMGGTSIVAEGYLSTVADQNWSVMGPVGETTPASKPAWVNALAIGQWYSIPNTAMSSVAPSPRPPGFSGPESKVIAWTSFVVDTRTSKVYSVANGGHEDYAGNEVNILDLERDQPVWSQALAPTPSNQLTNCQSYYADGRPTSRHTYYGATLDQFNDRIMLFGGARWCTNGGFHGAISSYNIQANNYNGAGFHPSLPSDFWGVPAYALNPLTGDVYVAGAGEVGRWNRSTNTFSNLNASGTGPSGNESMSAFDSTRGRLFVLGGVDNDRKLYTLSSNSWSTVTLSGANASNVAGQRERAMFYVPAIDRYLIRLSGSGSTVYQVNPATFQVTTFPTTNGGSIPSTQNGPYNKFLYVPRLGGAVYVPSYSGNAWFLRIH